MSKNCPYWNPFVVAYAGEHVLDAISRHRAATGHAGVCVIVRLDSRPPCERSIAATAG